MKRSALRRRPALWAAACLVSLLSCVDGNSVGTEQAVSIDFIPSFQVEPGDFSSGPIDAIRTRVLNAGTLVPISTSETTVDPAAAQWLLNLAVNLNGAESLSVIVEVELLSGGAVAWSGRLGPILARNGLSTSVQSVPVYRGPLDNLEVEAVSIVGAPTQILVGSTGTATSEVTLPTGSTATPEVFWVSLDPTIATVTVDAGVATITGVSAGTATIAAAAGPESDEVDVEVLGRVQSVTVSPTSATVLGPDQSVDFDANVLDGFGNPAPGEPVTWSSSDESVATVDSDGIATSVGTGTAEIRATAAGVTGFGTLTVDPPLAAIVWLGTVDSDWDNGANWLGGAVPTALDDVIIRDAPNSPNLASTTVIGALTIESPAVLDLADGGFLGVSGDLDVQPGAALQETTPETSVVQMVGTGTTLRGTIEPILTIVGSVSLSGNVAAAASVLVTGTGASLDISDYLMTVGGSFVTSSDGVLIMDGAIGTTLAVTGSVSFGGGSTDGLLTAGTIRVGEDFVAGGGSPTSFAPTGIHSVEFEGAVDGSIVFDNPGPLGQRFVLVWFDRAATTFFGSDFTVLSEMQVFKGVVDATDFAASLQGSLSDPGAGFQYNELHLIGDVTAIPSDVAGPVFIDGTVDWPTGSTITGELYVDGYLGVNPALLSVTDNVTVNGDLNVPAGSELSTDGILTLAAGSTMDVDGTVTATGGCVNGGATITGSGTHPCTGGLLITWVGGDAADVVSWDNPNNWSPAQLPGASDDVVIPATSWDPVLASAVSIGSLAVAAGVTVDQGSWGLTVSGDIQLDGTLANGQLNVTGPGTLLQGNVADLFITSDRILSSPVTASGFVITQAALTIREFTLTAASLRMETVNGRLVMTDSDGTVDIAGAVQFAGASHLGSLTAGQLQVGGDLSVTGLLTAFAATGTHSVDMDGSAPQTMSFTNSGITQQRFSDLFITNPAGVSLATTAYVTGDAVVSGQLTVGAAQALDIGRGLTLEAGSVFNVDGTVTAVDGCVNGGATITGTGTHPCDSPYTKVWVGGDVSGPRDTENPNNWAPVGVPVPTDLILVPVTANDPILSDVGEVAGITVEAGAVVDQNGFDLTVTGDLDAQGPITNGLLLLTGPGSVLEGSVDSFVLSADRALSGPLDATGSATLSRTFTIGANTLTVAGDLTTTTAFGRLDMRTAGGVVDIAGNALFDGGTESGWLTEGSIQVAGDFTVAATNSTASFAATLNSGVVLDGTTAQSVSFSNPGAGLQRFERLDIINSGPGVTFLSDVVATGEFDVNSASTLDASDDVVSVGASFNISPTTLLQDVVAIGDWVSVTNLVPANLTVSADFTVPNSFTVAGNVTTNRTMTIGGFTLTVTGDLTTTTAFGRLDMRTAGGVVDIAGNALFDGGTESGWLTEGSIQVAGDFTVAATNSTASFAATLNSGVVLDGTTAQSVSFSNPGAGLQRFERLDIINSGPGVTFLSDVVATGEFDVNSASTLDASDDVVSVGASFNISPTTLLQDVVAIGDWVSVTNLVPANLTVSADFTVPNSFTVAGNVTTNRTMTIGGFTLTVTGDLTTTTAFGRLDMRTAGGVVDIAGNALFDGGSESGWLTEGEIQFAGDFTANATNSTSSYVSTGNHTSTFDGNVAQSITFSTPGAGVQRFHHAAMNNTSGGIVFGSDVVATGDFSIPAGVTVNAIDDVLSVAGSFIDGSDGILLQELEIIGDLTAISGGVSANVTVNANFNMPGNFSVFGDVTLNRTLNVAANQLLVTGDLLTSTAFGRLDMRTPGGSVVVDGDMVFDGATEAGWLTEGQINLTGNLTATSTNSTSSFAGTANHRVVLNGSGLQTVTLSNPSTGQQRFADLSVFNVGSGVVFGSDVVVSGAFYLDTDVSVDASDDVVSVGGSFVNNNGGISLQELVVIGNLTALPATLTADVTVNFDFTLPGDFTVTGDVTTTRTLNIAATTLFVTGDLTTSTAFGRLDMRTAGGMVDVDGDILFDGGSESGWLTEGSIRTTGSLTATSTNSPVSFVGSGNHTTTFLGTAAQTVSFSNPGTGGQRFQNLVHENFNAGMNLATSAVVMGTFTADDVTMTRTGPVGTAMDVRGTMNVQFTTMVGLPLRLTSTVAGPSHLLGDVTFTSMDPADVQLYLELPGGINFPLNMSGMAFAITSFTTGAHLQTERGPGGFAEDFVAELFSPSPSGVSATILQGANTTVIWP